MLSVIDLQQEGHQFAGLIPGVSVCSLHLSYDWLPPHNSGNKLNAYLEFKVIFFIIIFFEKNNFLIHTLQSNIFLYLLSIFVFFLHSKFD